MLTLDEIRKTFAEFNVLCFDGLLGEPLFQLSRSRTTLGQVGYKRQRNSDGTWRYYDFRFRISTRTPMSKRELEDTILHEMIHFWILSNQWTDTSAHGTLFRRKMEELNTRFGRHITISRRRTAEEQNKDTTKRLHLVCVSYLSDGRVGVTPAVHTRFALLRRQMGRFPGVVRQQWYATHNPYFNRFPRAMTPKLYLANEEELLSHLTDAHILL